MADETCLTLPRTTDIRLWIAELNFDTVQVIEQPQWRELQARHHARVDAAVSAHLHRADRAQPHPVEDFLFQYYAFRPAALRRWHPGAGVSLAGAADRADWKFYAYSDQQAFVDTAAFADAREPFVRFVTELLRSTNARPAGFGCFGMHEWAMVYRGEVRHTAYPLRLGAAGTDEVVDAHQLKCTHFDAFRFFTDPARPLNSQQLERSSQIAMEQPGCLHAGMDCYKWAFKLLPIVSSDLVMDAFDLAKDIRVVDMRAAPYDLTSLGYPPIPVETAEGKAEYVRHQKGFADRSRVIRDRLLEAISAAQSLSSAAHR